jgi:hypothetical protein
MRAALGSTDEFYLKISSAVVSNAQGMLVTAVNEAQENFTYTHSLLTLSTIVTNAYNATASMDSMDMYPNLRQQYQTNKSTLGNIKNQISAANRTVSTSSSQSSSNSGGCYIATMVYGDYNHPQVMVLRDFRDEVLLHSLAVLTPAINSTTKQEKVIPPF